MTAFRLSISKWEIMRWIALCSFLSLAGHLVLAETTEEMLSSCRQVAEAKVSGDAVMLTQDFESGVCWGAVASLQELSRWVAPQQKKPVLHVCAPKQSTRSQLILIFVEYAKHNPKLLHEDFVTVALAALRDAFPCSME